MANIRGEDRHWLEFHWKTMAKSVLNVMIPLADEVVEAIIATGTVEEREWTRFIDRSARALNKIRTELSANDERRPAGGSPPRSVMYAAAVSLLGDSEPMKQQLIRARERLASKDGGRVLWGCLHSGLYRMRMRATCEIENRAKTWRRLEKIVALLRDQQGAPAWNVFAGVDDGRYSDAFCKEVADYVGDHHPDDHNLPDDADSVKGFFAEFCDDFDFFQQQDDTEIDEDDIELLPDRARGHAYLAECKEELESPFAEVYEISLGRTGRSISAFCIEAGMGLRKFHHIRAKAEAVLSECVTHKLRDRMMAAAR